MDRRRQAWTDDTKSLRIIWVKMSGSSVLDQMVAEGPPESGRDAELLIREARRRQRRRWLAVGSAAAVVAAGTGLGVALSGGRRPPSPPRTRSHPTVPTLSGGALPSCSSADLKAAVGGVQGTSGQWYITLQFTKVGAGRCAVSGYPAVSLVGAGGQPVGGPLADTLGSLTTGKVVLTDGQVAVANVTVPEVVPVLDAQEGCQEVTFTAIDVSAPVSAVIAGSGGDWTRATTTCLSGGGVPSVGPLHTVG